MHTPPLPPFAHPTDPAREQAARVVDRLLKRFRAETHLPEAAHAPVRDAAFHQWLAQASGMLPGKLEWVRPELADLDLVPIEEGRQRLCLALRGEEPVVGLVLADPFDRTTRLWLEARLRDCGHPRTRWYVAPADALLAFYDRLAQAQRERAAEDSRTGPIEVPPLPVLTETVAAPADDSPVLRFVGRLLQDALAAGASDVHLASTAGGLQIRYRLDGVLLPMDSVDGRDFGARVIRRLKVLAELEPTVNGRPQDGRLELTQGERRIDARLSVLPSRHGEDAVLRILDRQGLLSSGRMNLAGLGLDAVATGAIRRLVQRPHGLLLVTGPAGSGTTTTLYGLLGEQPAGEDKLITLEDPVEAPLAGALQLAVGDSAGLGCAHALRAALRHDPDRLMVGDLRDTETARLVVQAALSGQRVYAGVHAGQAFDAIGRLITLGVDPYDLAAALNGVVAQRLLRRVCPHCAEDDQPTPEMLLVSGLPKAVLEEGWTFRRGRGCDDCRGSGYLGRQAIAQTLTLDPELRGLIAERASPAMQRAAAERRGLITLRDAALELVCAGITTLEEANRVTAVQE